MRRQPDRLYLADRADQERSYRPSTPHPGYANPRLRYHYYEIPFANSRARHHSTDTAHYRYSEDLQRQIDEQNARIAHRLPRVQGRYFEAQRYVPKRVRFLLPISRHSKDDGDELAREFAKLSIRGSYAKRCSRCGQKLRWDGP
jgi:hypothetical protein